MAFLREEKKILAKVQNNVVKISVSIYLKSASKKEIIIWKEHCRHKRLILVVPKRWNSVFLMMTRVIYLLMILTEFKNNDKRKLQVFVNQ